MNLQASPKDDPEDVLIGEEHMSYFFKPVSVLIFLCFLVPVILLTIFSHTLIVHIVGSVFLYTAVCFFMSAWAEVAKETFAPQNYIGEKYTMIITKDRLPKGWFFCIPAPITVVYFALAQIWLIG